MSRLLYVVPHSHWDREWYHTFQQFRLRLVALIDTLLDTLAADPAYMHFMLDGQTVVLEDYAEIRPERAPELRAAIKAGRISIGPWYVHPDEFLVSGEAIVRNLLMGARLCEEWGGRMAVGYVPDQFGHIAQLPRIWRGFGIESAVLWRGVARDTARLAFRWRALDGSEVLASTLPEGYNNGEHLPLSGHALAERLRSLARPLEHLAAADQPLLVLNGGDHGAVQTALPAALTAAQEGLGQDYTLVQGPLASYIAALRQAGPPDAMIRGELRDSRDVFLLPAVLSARIPIKQRNATIQTLLERQAEPLAVAAAALGSPYPLGELRQSWRYLLHNHPHDSICGCGIDQVAAEMGIRFDWAEQIGQAVRDTALSTLADRIGSLAPGAEDPHTLAITVWNGASVAAAGRIELEVSLIGEASGYEIVDSGGEPVPHVWLGDRGEAPTRVEIARDELPDFETILAQIEGDRVFGMGIHAVSMRVLGRALHIDVTTGTQAIVRRAQLEQAARDASILADDAGCQKVVATIHRATHLKLAAWAPSVPACGYRTLLLRPRARAGAAVPSAPEESAPPTPAIENAHYRVEATDTGILTINARKGSVRVSANLLRDGGDAGDLYTYSPPPYDTVISSETSVPTIERWGDALGQCLRIRQILRVPRALAASRQERELEMAEIAVTTEVRLAADDPLIRFTTTVDNTAQDHRLRLHISTPFAADHVHVADAFALVERAAQPERDGEWAEAPVGTAPHQGFVIVHGQGGAVALAARGLPEYEVAPNDAGGTDLALTLLRCVGWLSRGDLPNRLGEAGPTLPTPAAQCLGAHTFAYALALTSESWRALPPIARAFATELHAHIAPCAEGELPGSAAIVRVSPDTVVLSTLKGAENGDGAILRLYNESNQAETARVALLVPARSAELTDLDERPGGALWEGPPRAELSLPIPARGIVSARLRWSESGEPEPTG
ncbi:MAG TPA: glycoside hydrolase family 38 C-terminal domain-containing protein [Chloroflexota bacterium]|nr:glycoside hydrolase family 38 C-terminal domain-containing protein [Chloroflexota bacterium]